MTESLDTASLRGPAASGLPGFTADAIIKWFTRGGCQAPSGAFCGWMDTAVGRLSAPYPEVTGYGLTFFSWLRLSDTDVARRAADWLVARADEDDFTSRPERADGLIYAFDVAMIAHGLLRHGSDTGRQEVCEAGMRHIDLLARAVDERGHVRCLISDTAAPDAQASWSTHGSAHLLKLVQPLLSAAKSGNAPAYSAASEIVRSALFRFGGSPPLETCPGGGIVSLHALCYAAEGLWSWASHGEDEKAMAASRTLTSWIWQHQLPGGGFPGFVHPTVTGCQTDVLAQSIRLAALHSIAGPAVDAATARLIDSIDHSGDQASALYRPDGAERHQNSWASMFAVQALRLRDHPATCLHWWELV